MARAPEVLLISREDIRRVMTQDDYLHAAAQAFGAAAAGTGSAPPPLHLPAARGGFHAKGATISLERDYAAVKVNGNFPGNPSEHGLPTVQGAIILADASDGRLLAILDSIEVTLRRTAAASALAARLLARPDSSTLLVCGCGEQGRAHVEALRRVLPLRTVLLWDRQADAAETLAEDVGATAVDDLAGAALAADVIACCTSARSPFLKREMVRPGTFIAAVGADSPDKSEIAAELMAAATVVADSLPQCAAMGDLHHAIDEGSMTDAEVHAELAEIVAGTKAGRCSPDQILIFDSTGVGLQDAAAAALIYERCVSAGTVASIALAHR